MRDSMQRAAFDSTNFQNASRWLCVQTRNPSVGRDDAGLRPPLSRQIGGGLKEIAQGWDSSS
jgi:hypothetical protein